jgi:predicted PurR-regulated permease PerM
MGTRVVTGSSAQKWLLALAVIYTLYFARTLLIPVVLALLVASVLTPLVNFLHSKHIPRTVSALLMVACIGMPLAILGIELAEPAQKWMQRVPELGMQVSEELDAFTESLTSPRRPETTPREKEPEKDSFFDFFGWFGDDEEDKPQLEATPAAQEQDPVKARLIQGGIEAAIAILAAAPILIAQLLTFVILVLFQLIFGARLYDNAIGLVPRLREKRQMALAVTRVQRQLSRYIVTVSLINTGLGIVTAIVLLALGVEDALLWGVMVGLLNFAPYVGPLVSVCILSIAGIVQFGFGWAALIPALAYFLVNLVEAQFITPLVLGRHMRLNPLLLVLWIIVWGWLWGAAGVLMAVPLLVCLKLLAQQFGVMTYLVQLVETKA